mgnify:CR=1 FL=1
MNTNSNHFNDANQSNNVNLRFTLLSLTLVMLGGDSFYIFSSFLLGISSINHSSIFFCQNICRLSVNTHTHKHAYNFLPYMSCERDLFINIVCRNTLCEMLLSIIEITFCLRVRHQFF